MEILKELDHCILVGIMYGSEAEEALLTDVAESSTDVLVTGGMLWMKWRGNKLEIAGLGDKVSIITHKNI